MSFGEMLVLGVIAMVVVGPRRLPSMLRSAGQLIGKVRRMAMDIRTESGIDEILDAEGIRSEIDNFRRLAAGEIPPDDVPRNVVPDREREYPRLGCDSYGALSEDLVAYVAAPALLAAPSLPAPSPPADDSPPAAPSPSADLSPPAAPSLPAAETAASFADSPVDADIKN